jgi:hypothetical protein
MLAAVCAAALLMLLLQNCWQLTAALLQRPCTAQILKQLRQWTVTVV